MDAKTRSMLLRLRASDIVGALSAFELGSPVIKDIDDLLLSLQSNINKFNVQWEEFLGSLKRENN